MKDSASAHIAIQKRNLTKSMELLLGIVTGIVADRQLQDLEVLFLKSWIADHPDVSGVWPGCVIADAIDEVLKDGVITDSEREHLLSVLQELAVTDFASTGSASAEVLQLPINDNATVSIRGRHVCHSGEFIFGTRAKCQELTIAAGGIVSEAITRKVAYLVIGSNVSRDWAHTSYGRKIEQAVTLQNSGIPINIISEKRWLEAIRP